MYLQPQRHNTKPSVSEQVLHLIKQTRLQLQLHPEMERSVS